MVRSRLEQLFDTGQLVRPTDRQPNLVHLARALASLAGVPDMSSHPATEELIDHIGPAEHLVFILVDGLGMNILRRLPADSFLRSHFVMQIQAVCPSTTACALSTIATAQYPNHHGTAGWFTHVPELGLTATTLPFLNRLTGEPLAAKGIGVEQVLLLPPVFPRMKHRAITIVPALIANTVYNIYMRGGTAGAGYFGFAHAMDRIIGNINESSGPTYTHLYLPEIDTLSHKRGTHSPELVNLAMQIDHQLRRLRDTLAGRARIVIVADHGLIDVPPEDQTLLMSDDPLLLTLEVPPTGDARMPIFHVREGRQGQFLDMFHTRFDDRMILVETDEIEAMELFGPGRFSERARPRFGHYIAIPFRPATLAYHSPTKPLGHLCLAVHAGLSADEMEVPLVIA